MRNKILLILAIIFFLFALGFNPFFVVDQREQAVVLKFGKPVTFKEGDKEVKFINTPGLKLKVPVMHEVKFFDARILNFEATDKEVFDLEKKTLTVNAFAKYKILNPLTFYEKVTDEDGMERRLNKIFEASLRDVIGSVPLSELLTDARKDLMQQIEESVSASAADFGIKVFDVRIVRADLPPENSNAIYKRMYAERSKEAREYRAQGAEEAKKIRSEADKEATILLAEARKEAEITRGQGDALAIKTFASAFNKDPKFYDFYRSMQAYRATLKHDNTRMVLSPNSEFMQHFESLK